MGIPQILIEFAERAQEKFGKDAAGCNNDGMFVFFEDTVVHVFLDQNTTRAVAWTELRRPEHVAIDAVERAAAECTGDTYLEKALAVGVNRAADLVVLGRSFDQDALGNDAGIEIISEIGHEAPAAEKRLAATAMGFSGAPRRRPPVLN